ncbi:MAG TPA: hypothetical protein VIW69_14215, partial [Candidatus Elarobacter sp.]
MVIMRRLAITAPIFVFLAALFTGCSGGSGSAVPREATRAPDISNICPQGKSKHPSFVNQCCDTDCPPPPDPTPQPTLPPSGSVVPIIWDDSRRELQTYVSDNGSPHLSVGQGMTTTLTVYCTNCYDSGVAGLGTPFSVSWFASGLPPGVSVTFSPVTTYGNSATEMFVQASNTASVGNWAFTYYACRQDQPSLCSDYTVVDLTVFSFLTGPSGEFIPPAIWNKADANRCKAGSGQTGPGCAWAVNNILQQSLGHKIPTSDNDTSYLCHLDGQRPHVCQSVWVPDIIEWGLAKGYLKQISENDAQKGDLTVQDGTNYINGMNH